MQCGSEPQEHQESFIGRKGDEADIEIIKSSFNNNISNEMEALCIIIIVN